MIQLHYWRKHLPTNTVYLGTFNDAQIPDMAFMGIRMIEAEAKKAIAKWNRDPQNTTWVYEYIGIRTPEVHQWEREQACQSTSR